MSNVIDHKKLWDGVLTDIELTVSKGIFSTWFRDTYISKIDDGTAYISVPNAFARDWMHGKYHKHILKHLREVTDAIRALEYVISKDGGKRPPQSQKTIINPTHQLPLQEPTINKEDNLNKRYTFENLVVGPFNELSFAAAQAIIKNPGRVYNPFFIFGNTGHGKTHLIQAMGNHIKQHYPEKKVLYTTSEKFAQDYVDAIQGNKMGAFKEKYRKYDLFIMDDIQFLSGKEKIQEELFHLFNTMYEAGKQIIFSADKHPNVIGHLEDRLKSRFSSGMIVDLPYPDVESRTAILKAKATQQDYIISDEILQYIAACVESNIRELEGILNSVICQSQLRNRELSLQEVKNLIKNNTKPKKNVSVKDIVKIVADFYNIDEESVYNKTRRKEVVKPRQVAMYILREDCNISYPSIGQKMGGRDHTTVIHSCEKIKNDIKSDSALSSEINQIRALL
jgi:chromosomal replication initiator protein